MTLPLDPKILQKLIELSSPSFCSFSYSKEEFKKLREPYFASLSDVEHLKKILEENDLKREEYICNRFKYKLKNAFKREKAYQTICQLNKSIKKFFEKCSLEYLFKLCEDLNIPDNTQIKDCFLPSKQVIQSSSVHILGCYSILLKIERLSMQIFSETAKQISRGLFIATNTVISAFSSRIWVVARKYMILMKKCYNSLAYLSTKLRSADVEWISFELPHALETDSTEGTSLRSAATEPESITDSSGIDLGQPIQRKKTKETPEDLIKKIKENIFNLKSTPNLKYGKQIKLVLKDDENLRDFILKNFVKSVVIRKKIENSKLTKEKGLKKLKMIWRNAKNIQINKT